MAEASPTNVFANVLQKVVAPVASALITGNARTRISPADVAQLSASSALTRYGNARITPYVAFLDAVAATAARLPGYSPDKHGPLVRDFGGHLLDRALEASTSGSPLKPEDIVGMARGINPLGRGTPPLRLDVTSYPS